jgi:hypothetical protein
MVDGNEGWINTVDIWEAGRETWNIYQGDSVPELHLVSKRNVRSADFSVPLNVFRCLSLVLRLDAYIKTVPHWAVFQSVSSFIPESSCSAHCNQVV